MAWFIFSSSVFGFGFACAGGLGFTVFCLRIDLVENNRLATLEEQKRIDELAKDNEREQLLYQAAACALIHCSAEFADDDQLKELYEQLEELGNDENLKSYRDELDAQDYQNTHVIKIPGANGYVDFIYGTTDPLFKYDKGDELSDLVAKFNNDHQITTRLGGIFQVGLAVGEGTLAIALSPSCTTVVACSGVAYLTWSAVDNGLTGITVIIDGKSYTTQTGKGLANILNISESDADLLFGATTSLVSAKKLSDLASSSLSSGNKLTEKELEKIKSELDRVGTLDSKTGQFKPTEVVSGNTGTGVSGNVVKQETIIPNNSWGGFG